MFVVPDIVRPHQNALKTYEHQAANTLP